MNKNSKIYVAGHQGLLGSAIVRRLERESHTNILKRTHAELDLSDFAAVKKFFENEKPEYVFLAAAKVGGIKANNTRRAEFIYDNLTIQNNIIHNAWLAGVKKLLFLGSSCIYPKLSPQPIREEYFLTGPLEKTNEPYAVAKIAGIVMCQSYNAQYGTNFISVMPTNLYGPNDNFDLASSHVLPALIRKFSEAAKGKKESVELWGTGSPRREFLHVDDAADACFFLMDQYNDSSIINIGTGNDVSIRELSEMIRDITAFKGEILWNASYPDGTPQKLLDVSKLSALGWNYAIELEKGIAETIAWFKKTYL